MDIDYLHRRRQASLLKSKNEPCERTREVHWALAQGYGERISKAERAKSEEPA